VAVTPEYLVRRYRETGSPRRNWMDIVRRHLEDMDTTWVEAKELATN